MKLDQVWDTLIEVRFNRRILWKWRERAARLPMAPCVKCSHYFKQKQICKSDNKSSGLSPSAARNHFPASVLTPLALSERSGKLLISRGNGRFDVVFCCGLAAEPAHGDKHPRAGSGLLLMTRRAIHRRFFPGEGSVFVLKGSVPSSVSHWLHSGCKTAQLDFTSTGSSSKILQ